MQVKREPSNGIFQPFRIVIDVQSQVEHDALLEMSVYDASIPELIEDEEQRKVIEALLVAFQKQLNV